MKKEMFAELMGSAQEALEHARGKRSLRTTVLPLQPTPLNARAVRRVRATLHASQAVFEVDSQMTVATLTIRNITLAVAMKGRKKDRNLPKLLTTVQ